MTRDMTGEKRPMGFQVPEAVRLKDDIHRVVIRKQTGE